MNGPKKIQGTVWSSNCSLFSKKTQRLSLPDFFDPVRSRSDWGHPPVWFLWRSGPAAGLVGVGFDFVVSMVHFIRFVLFQQS